MKKILMLGLLAITLAACGSLRSTNETYYATFFGISIESLVYGDGLIVDKVAKFNSPLK
ncbi:MAG: hypothetical protein LBL75_02505 [Rickettsiales bacterium]|jgi:hypothetical protein|nr:hypothetical protein [Rickettsiales bacterium]